MNTFTRVACLVFGVLTVTALETRTGQQFFDAALHREFLFCERQKHCATGVICLVGALFFAYVARSFATA